MIRRIGDPLLTTGKNSSGELDLSGVEVGTDRIVGDTDVLAWLTTHKTLGLTAFQLGVLERALELTAEYARTREQFDRPIGSFQAVSARLADDYIDIKGLGLALVQASWRLSEDLPADLEVATAAFWAAEATASPTPPCTFTAVSGSTSTTRCTATSWRPNRPSSLSAVPPHNCGTSAASWPTPGLTAPLNGAPTVPGLVARLVDVDDRGIHADDGSYVSWRQHVQAGADLAAALRGAPGPGGRRTSACYWATRRSSPRSWSPRRKPGWSLSA